MEIEPQQKQKGPLSLDDLDALLDETPEAELIVKPSVTVIPGIELLKDYELEEDIKRKKRLLDSTGKNLPDKGAKLRVIIKCYEDEFHRRKVNPRSQVQKVVDVEQKQRQATSSSAVGVSNDSRQENLSSHPQSNSSFTTHFLKKIDEDNTNGTAVNAFSNEMPHFKHCNNQTVLHNRAPKRRKRHRSSFRQLPSNCPSKLSKRDTFDDDKRCRSNSTLSLQTITKNLSRHLSEE